MIIRLDSCRKEEIGKDCESLRKSKVVALAIGEQESAFCVLVADSRFEWKERPWASNHGCRFLRRSMYEDSSRHISVTATDVLL